MNRRALWVAGAIALIAGVIWWTWVPPAERGRPSAPPRDAWSSRAAPSLTSAPPDARAADDASNRQPVDATPTVAGTAASYSARIFSMRDGAPLAAWTREVDSGVERPADVQGRVSFDRSLDGVGRVTLEVGAAGYATRVVELAPFIDTAVALLPTDRRTFVVRELGSRASVPHAIVAVRADMMSEPIELGRTGRDGTLVVAAPWIAHSIEVACEGFDPGRFAGYGPIAMPADSVAPAPEDRVILDLLPASVLRVEVVDPAGAAIPTARFARLADDGTPMPLLPITRSSAAMIVHELAIATGTSLRVDAPGCAARVLRVDPGQAPARRIVLQRGLRLKVAVWSFRSAVADAEVTLHARGGTDDAGTIAAGGVGRTDARGAVTFEGLERGGEYTLIARAAGFSDASLKFRAGDADAELWHIDLEMHTPVEVIGVVVDPDDRPLAGVEVQVRADPARPPTPVFSNAAGAFRLPAPRQDARLLLRREGFCALEVMVPPAPPNGDVDLGRLTLNVGGAIEGRVEDELGVGIAGARVFYEPLGDPAVPGSAFAAGAVVAAGDGSFVATGLCGGSYLLRPVSPVGEVTVVESSSAVRVGEFARLKLPRLAELRVQVYAEGERPPWKLYLQVPAPGRSMWMGRSAPAGSDTLRVRVSADHSWFKVMAQGYAPIVRSTTLDPERITEVQVALQRGHAVTIQLTASAEDVQLAGTLVRVEQVDPTGGGAQDLVVGECEANGKVEFRLTDGRYRVAVYAPGDRVVEQWIDVDRDRRYDIRIDGT